MMKAVVMTSPGGPEVLQIQDVAMPEIRSGTEMLIKIRAAGINPVDTKLRSQGTWFPDREPTILGCDAAGIVERSAAKHLKKPSMPYVITVIW